VFLRALAAEGRTVLISSHVLSEVEQTVDDVVIIASGRLVHASTLDDLAQLALARVRVTSPDAAALATLVAQAGWSVADGRAPSPHSIELVDIDAATVGAAAFAAGLELHELSSLDVGLEQTFLELTSPHAAHDALEGGAR
jgi:ABC-2 type transport system ATP-binding protein